MNLSALPSSIGSLQTLDVLYAQNNSITEIVNAVSQLNDLNIVDLSNNNITTLGTQLQNKPQLTLLDLSDNEIVVINSLAFSGMSALQELYFARNLLNAIPANITTTVNTLQTVSFADNAISTLPSTSFFNQFGALRTLNLS
jgi:leucine-rich repeat protein SHOC2